MAEQARKHPGLVTNLFPAPHLEAEMPEASVGVAVGLSQQGEAKFRESLSYDQNLKRVWYHGAPVGASLNSRLGTCRRQKIGGDQVDPAS